MTTTRLFILIVLAAALIPLVVDIESRVQALLATFAAFVLLFGGLLLWSFTRPGERFTIYVNQLRQLQEALRDEGRHGSFVILGLEDDSGEMNGAALIIFENIHGEVALEWSLDESSPVNVRDAERFRLFAQSIGIDLIDTRPDDGNSLRTTSNRQVQLCEQVFRTFYGLTDDSRIFVRTHNFAPKKTL